MEAARKTPRSRQRPARPARRLSRAARRDQLARAGLAIAARRGYSGTSLDEVAERAGVTRNLVYHYFPRGRIDLYLAAMELAGELLTADWTTDPDVPLDQRLTGNFARIVEHAMEPSDAWLLYRQALSSSEPEVSAAGARYRTTMIESIAQNHFGTTDPPPYARLALDAYIAFAETALDGCRVRRLDPAVVTAMLTRSLLAIVEAAREAR